MSNLEGILGGVLGLAIIGILVYYVRAGVNAGRDADALEAESKAQDEELARVNEAKVKTEMEERREEDATVAGISRDDANKLLSEALKDDVN